MIALGTLLGGRYRLDAQIGQRRDVHRLSRVRHRARTACRDQADAPRDRVGLRPARALPPRGARRGAAQPPAHRHRDRRRRGRRRRRRRDGRRAAPYIVLEYVEGETLQGPDPPRGAAGGLRGDRLHDRDRARARRGARPPDRASRRQAPERADQRGRRREDHRLRHRAHAQRGGPDDGRSRARHDRLRVSRAGARPAGHRAVGHLLAGGRALRDAHRRGSLPRRVAGGGRDAPRARGRARRPAAPARRVGGDRLRARSRGRQGPRAGATPTPQAWWPTSRRCSRSRPRARARRPARSRACCARCPAPARAAAAAGACATRAVGRPAGVVAVVVAIASCSPAARPPRHRRRARRRPARGPAARRRSSQTAAHDYNPFGTGPENHDQIDNVVDGDPNTTWSTEQYYDGTLRRPAASARASTSTPRRACAAKALEIQTPTPGFAVQVYVADQIASLPYGSSTPLRARGWQGPVGASTDVRGGERIALALAGHPHRYYLVWLTHAAARRGESGDDRRAHAVQVRRPVRVRRAAAPAWRSSASRHRRSTSCG